jgi:hypothetical protein
MHILPSPCKIRTPRVLRHLRSHLVLMSLLLCVGCSGDDEPAPIGAPSSSAAAGPQISASPNPVPLGSEKFGTTTITWDTGDGSIGEVYVSVNGKPEKLFAGNRRKGSLEAPWIGKGEHEFRLYAGTEHKTVLASVMVTRAKSN